MHFNLKEQSWLHNPSDKRLAADGRGLQDHIMSDNFAKLAQSLYIAEVEAREAVKTHNHHQVQLCVC